MKTSTPDFFRLNVIFVTQKDIPFTHDLLPINKKMYSINFLHPFIVLRIVLKYSNGEVPKKKKS